MLIWAGPPPIWAMLKRKDISIGIPCLREIKFIVKMLDGWSKCPLYIYKRQYCLEARLVKIKMTFGPYMPTLPPVAATRRERAQKKPAFTAGGRREAEMATPTWQVE